MTKRLLILRHAKSSWSDERISDHDRPLNHRGESDALRLGAELVDLGRIPDRIICSTARRAADTAERLIRTPELPREIEFRQELYLAPADVYLRVISEFSQETRLPLIIGHNPGLEELLRHLTGKLVPLGTANLIELELNLSSWDECDERTRGSVRFAWSPKGGAADR